MNILIGITILLSCQLIGEFLVMWFALPIPGPVLGMFLLLVILFIRDKPGDSLNSTTSALLSHLSLLFVPAGVGVMIHVHSLGEQWLPIISALIFSTTITLTLSAFFMSVLMKISGKHDNG